MHESVTVTFCNSYRVLQSDAKNDSEGIKKLIGLKG